LREGLLFETEILWDLESKEKSWLRSLGIPCYSVWVGWFVEEQGLMLSFTEVQAVGSTSSEEPGDA
jgi:hypothetical protein